MTKSSQSLWVKVKTASWWSNLASKRTQLLYLVVLFSLPIQLGKHFWPSFTTLAGLRIDYLAPTFFLTDVFLVLLLISALPLLFPNRTKGMFLFVGFCLYLLISGLSSVSPLTSLYGVVQLLRSCLFGYLTAQLLNDRMVRKAYVPVLAGSVTLVCLLAVAQFFLQHSVGGLLYWVGERSFSLGTPGIADASLGGNLILRPYATFPHPNVLAGYLVITLSLLLFQQSFSFRNKKVHATLWPFCSLTVILLGSLTLILSLSRSGIAAFVMVSALWFIGRSQNKRLALGGSIAGVAALMAVLWWSGLAGRFTSLSLSDESVVLREQLLQAAWQMIRHYPLFGVGLKNFLVALPHFQPWLLPFSSLQPVHSIYVLWLAETGVVGTLFAGVFLWQTLRHIMKVQERSDRLERVLLLSAVGLLGLVDHYFLTLPQGQLLLAFVLGYLWTPIAVKTRRKPAQ